MFGQKVQLPLIFQTGLYQPYIKEWPSQVRSCLLIVSLLKITHVSTASLGARSRYRQNEISRLIALKISNMNANERAGLTGRDDLIIEYKLAKLFFCLRILTVLKPDSIVCLLLFHNLFGNLCFWIKAIINRKPQQEG